MSKKEYMKRVLVIGPGMEIGGVEKSLTGFLHAIDDHETEIDLFLFSHKGELLPLVGSNIHILPENPKLASVFEPVRSLFQKGKYYTAFIRQIMRFPSNSIDRYPFFRHRHEMRRRSPRAWLLP